MNFKNDTYFFLKVLATLNERFRHCISMTKMLNSENLLADSGLDPHSTAFTADRIIYNYAIEQCQAAALDELFGNPEECFQVCIDTKIIFLKLIAIFHINSCFHEFFHFIFSEIPWSSCFASCSPISNPKWRRQKIFGTLQRCRWETSPYFGATRICTSIRNTILRPPSSQSSRLEAGKFKNSTHFRETNPITKFHILSTAIEKNSFSLCVNVCVIIMFLRHLYRWKQKKADLTFSDGSGIPEIQVLGGVNTLNFRFRVPDPSLLHFLKHCLTY